MERGVAFANERLLSCGITSVHDASAHNDLRRLAMFRTWKERGLFAPRITMMWGVKGFRESGGESARRDDAPLTIRGVKIVADETTGSLYPPQTQLNEMVLAIHCAGLQVAIHAIEEPVVEAACNAIEYALQRQPRVDHRHRIEHCSVCPPPLRERIHRLAITVVTQPSFLYYSGDRYLSTVPDHQKAYLYPLRALLRQGIRVAAGSDFPVVDPNPWTAIYAAATRKAASGAVLGQEERIGAFDALQMYTERAAEASFEEPVKGSISVGKAADLAVLSADPMFVDADEIKDIRTVMTILNGEVVA
jgi:predicted amidohydrolase YtcJ